MTSSTRPSGLGFTSSAAHGRRFLGRRTRPLAALVAAIALAMGSALSASAFHLGTVAIELDGNVADGGATGVDWATLFNATGGDTGVPADDQLGGAGNDLDREFVVDFVVGASGPDPSYHEPSNKDNQPVFAAGGGEVWGCVSAANPTDKDDILNAYAVAYTGEGEDAGDLILDFGVERFDDSGTAYLGFWVFQQDVRCNTATGKFEGAKTNNDILMLINFSNGGDNVTVNAFAWHPGTNPNSDAGSFTPIGTGVGCDIAVDAAAGTGVNMCAITNGIGDQSVLTPWATEDKQKPGPPSPDFLNTLEPPEFVEGGINLTDAFTAAGVTPPACFGSFMAETRSSDSLSATLKDFALGDLNTCDARITITPSQTNRVGTAHTFTVDVDQNTGGGFGPALVGNVDVSLVGANGISNPVTIDAALSTCDDGQPTGDNLDASGRCTIVVNSSATGTITANASVVVSLGGGSTLTRDTDPATATGSGPGGSGPAVKTYVDATIDITGDGTNRVGAAHTFTVTVKTDSGDGNGLVAAAGVIPTVTLTDAYGAASVVDDTPDTDSTCDDGTNASGVCIVKFSSATTGTTTGTASASVTVAGLTFGINTTNDAQTAGNEAVLKTWVDAYITIAADGTNGITESHTFTVTVYEDAGDGLGFVAAAGENVNASISGTGSITGGTCDNSGGDTDSNGQCTVIVYSAVAGVGTVHATSAVSVGGITVNVATDGTAPDSGDATKTWVDGSLTWLKHDNNGQLLGGATFVVCRTFDRFGVDITDECVTIVDDVDGTDDTAGDWDGTPGEFALGDLLLGRYTITETVAPGTYTLDPFVETIELTLAAPDKAATHIWVNTPGGEGCTPGYWRNHTSAWDSFSDPAVAAMPDGYSHGTVPYEFITTTSFNSYFDLTSTQSGVSNSFTMLDAVSANGGGVNMLMRHGVSALLNVEAVNYPISDFIGLYDDLRNAFLTKTYEPLASTLAGYNNLDHQNCPT